MTCCQVEELKYLWVLFMSTDRLIGAAMEKFDKFIANRVRAEPGHVRFTHVNLALQKYHTERSPLIIALFGSCYIQITPLICSLALVLCRAYTLQNIVYML